MDEWRIYVVIRRNFIISLVINGYTLTGLLWGKVYLRVQIISTIYKRVSVCYKSGIRIKFGTKYNRIPLLAQD